MQERRVTIVNDRFVLDEPSLIQATLNLIEQERAYPRSEARVDRFMLKLVAGCACTTEERAVLCRQAFTALRMDIDPVSFRIASARPARQLIRSSTTTRSKDYIVHVTFTTPDLATFDGPIADWVPYDASPGAALAMTIAARTSAFPDGRAYVTPQDVKDVAMEVLRHRVIVTCAAEAAEKTPGATAGTALDHAPVP